MKELEEAIEKEWQEVDNAIKQHDKEKAKYHNQMALWLEELIGYRRKLKNQNTIVAHFLRDKKSTITFKSDDF